MKNIVITFFMIVLFASSFAQTKLPDYISFSVGATVPTGSFAQADAGSFNNYNNSSGYAKTGVAFGVDAAHYIFSRWSVRGSLYFSEHGGLNGNDVANLAASYQDAFGVDQAAVSTSGTYKSLNLMVGPAYSIPLNKITLDAWVMGGLIKSFSTPEIAVVLTDADIDYPFTQKSSSASAFGWQAGLGARYKLKERLSLLVKGEYFGSSGIAIENTDRVNMAGRMVTNQPMSWINFSTGLVLSIGK